MKCRFDWLTVTFKDWNIDDVYRNIYDLLGVDIKAFIPVRGRYGYKSGLYYEHITILYDGSVDGMGVCFDISGQGCSYLYSLSDNVDSDYFNDIFKVINSFGGNITRLDVALDCFDSEISLDDIHDAVVLHNYRTLWKSVDYTTSIRRGQSHCGRTFQFGSRRSNALLRIYDKAAEQGIDGYWVRLELQFRNVLAHSFADTYINSINDMEFMEVFLGVLNHYIAFVERTSDSNISRAKLLSWWDNFINVCRSTLILRHADYEPYTINQLFYNVTTRFGQAFKAFYDLFGADKLLSVVSNIELKNRNYESLVSYYKHDILPYVDDLQSF